MKLVLVSGFVALTVIMGCSVLRSTSSVQEVKPTYWDESAQSCSRSFPVHLTFDDGPTEETTSKILDALKAKGAKATFFILTSRLDPFYIRQIRDSVSYSDLHLDKDYANLNSASYNATKLSHKTIPQMIRDRKRLIVRMLSEGHTVGSHTHRHKLHNRYAADESDFSEIERELPKDRKSDIKQWFRSRDEMLASLTTSLKELASTSPRLARPQYLRLPGGAGFFREQSSSEKIISRLKEGTRDIKTQIRDRKLTHVLWSVDSEDYRYHNNDCPNLTTEEAGREILKRVLKEVCLSEGGIILMHDVMPVTAASIGTWIEGIRKAGHVLVSLKEIEKSEKYESILQTPERLAQKLKD